LLCGRKSYGVRARSVGIADLGRLEQLLDLLDEPVVGAQGAHRRAAALSRADLVAPGRVPALARASGLTVGSGSRRGGAGSPTSSRRTARRQMLAMLRSSRRARSRKTVINSGSMSKAT
jgi:hypothetical protein